jgi:hypothetical protein
MKIQMGVMVMIMVMMMVMMMAEELLGVYFEIMKMFLEMKTMKLKLE